MIQTVTQKISKADISGTTLIHEHIQCVSNDMLHAFGNRWLDRAEVISRALEVLEDMKKGYGLDLLVDGTPIDLGRDSGILKELSERSGIKIVASSGLYYFPSMITMGNSEKDIAEWFTEELISGIDNTAVKPGILKCATECNVITEENEKRIGALGRVQEKTGLPLYLHTLHRGSTARDALRILEERGADAEKIIIGHFDDVCEYDYVCEFIKRGCFVSFDRRHYTAEYTENVAKMLIRLHDGGYGNKILISNDCCIYSDFCATGKKWTKREDVPDTIAYVFEALKKDFLKYGGDEKTYIEMVTSNVLSALDS